MPLEGGAEVRLSGVRVAEDFLHATITDRIHGRRAAETDRDYCSVCPHYDEVGGER